MIKVFLEDTIVAISSAPGEGGIGIIRMSGEDSLKIANEIFKSIKEKKIQDYSPRTMIYGHIKENEEVVDEVLLCYMKSPHTYTKEDVIEINCHGGHMSLNKILTLALSKGARLAEPGEFTKRAFLNGRIDLSQAEAVIDIIKAKTDASLNLAQKQLEGGLSRRIKDLRKDVTQILAQIEATLDFPEEDIEHITMEKVELELKSVLEKMFHLEKTSQTGKILRDGLRCVIVGKPNVGKSSLMNALLKEARAIVTDIPGTTRDVIEEMLNVKGIPIRIMDTAGIRQTKDIVEKIGVEKSKEFLNIADLVILVLDSSTELTKEDYEIMEDIKEKQVLVILNKTDLDIKWNIDETLDKYNFNHIVKISALKELGIEDIEDKIEELVFSNEIRQTSDVMITNARQKDAIVKAINSAKEALKSIENQMPLDFVEIDVKNIWDSLGNITGETIREDLLDTIFSEFCIGK